MITTRTSMEPLPLPSDLITSSSPVTLCDSNICFSSWERFRPGLSSRQVSEGDGRWSTEIILTLMSSAAAFFHGAESKVTWA